MKTLELQVTYRKGRPIAGYLYLPRRRGDKAKTSREPLPGLVVDYADDGRAIGIEIRSPGYVHLHQVNEVLEGLGMEPLEAEDFAPLQAA